jgi:hypothetical protein
VHDESLLACCDDVAVDRVYVEPVFVLCVDAAGVVLFAFTLNPDLRNAEAGFEGCVRLPGSCALIVVPTLESDNFLPPGVPPTEMSSAGFGIVISCRDASLA